MAKFVNKDTTREFKDADGDTLVLRTELSKGESDRISELQQNYRISPQAAAGAPTDNETVEIRSRLRDINREFFTIMAVSFTVDGSAQKIDGDTYSNLDEDSGAWVDECIGEVLRERREAREARAEGNGRPPSVSPISPAAEPESTGTGSTPKSAA